MIDSGFPTRVDDTRESLGQLGLSVDDVDALLYTHSHVDHMGGGVVLAGESEIEHVFWEGTIPATEGYHAYYSTLPKWSDWLAEELSPGPFRDKILPAFSRPSKPPLGTGEFRRSRPMSFGEQLDLGGLVFECVDGRGHDPFHAGWYLPDRGWLFSGDVVLRNPTPILPVLGDDIASYRRTLDSWLTRFGDLDLLLPGHGRERSDAENAIRDSIEHLRALYNAVRSGLADGVFDPSRAAGQLLGPSPTSFRSAFVAFGGMLSQLYELEANGEVERASPTTWRACGELAPYDARVFR